MKKSIFSEQPFLSKLAALTTDPLFIIDEENRIVFWNTAAARTFGSPQSEVFGRDIKDLNLQINDQLASLRTTAQLSKSSFNSRIEAVQISSNFLRHGTEITAEWTLFPYFEEGKCFIAGIGRDISRREPFVTEEAFHQIFETNSAIKLIIDPQSGSILEANQAAVKFYGYSKDQLLHMTIMDINCLPQDDVKAEMNRAQCEDRLYFNFKHRLASGEIRDVEVYSDPLATPNGTLLHSIIHDITERKQAEHQLTLLNFALDAMHEAVFLTDEAGHFCYANSESCRVLGYRREDLLKMKVADLDPDFPIERWPRHWSELVNRGSLIFETRHCTKDGAIIPVEITANYVEYEGKCYNLAFARDISLRKQAEEKRQLLAAIVETSDDAIITKDLNGMIMSWNQGATNIYQYSADEAIGNPVSMLVPPDYDDEIPQLLEKLRKGEHVDHYETVRRRKDGNDITVSLAISPLKNHGDEIIGASVIARDISERKRAEMEILRKNRVLKMLGESNQALIHHTDEASLLNDICRIVVEVGGYLMAWVGYAEHDEAKTVHAVAHAGNDSGYIGSAKLSWGDNERGQGPGGITIRSGKPYIVRDLLTDPCFAPWRQAAVLRGYKSMMALPLIVGGETIGAMGIYSDWTNAFDIEEAEILNQLASDLAYGIAALRMREEREQAMTDLRTSEMNYRIVADNTYDWEYWLTPDGHFRYSSPSCYRITGYSQEEFRENAALLLNIIHPLDRKLVSEHWDSTLQQVTTHDDEKDFRIIHRDGLVRWIGHVCQPVYDSAGCFIGIRGSNRDITDRKRAEERVNREVARSKLLLDLYMKAPNMSDHELYDFVLEKAVSLTDSDIGFLHFISDDQKDVILTMWNSGALKNCTAEFDTHYPIERAGNWVDCVRLKRAVIYNDFPNSPGQKGLPDGHSPVKRFMSIPVIEKNKVRIIFGVGNKEIDYDEHDARQLQLIANELHKIVIQRHAADTLRKLSHAVEQSPVSIVITDTNGDIEYVNPKFTEVSGYTREEALGKNPRILKSGELPLEIYDQLWKSITSGKEWRGELCNRKKNGELFWESVSISPIHEPTTNFISHFVAVKEDITDRKRMEAATLHQKAVLEGVINSTTSAVFSIDRNYKYTSFNQTHADTMFKIYGARIEVGMNLLSCMSNVSDRAIAKDNLDRVLRGEHVVAESSSGDENLMRRYFRVAHNPIFDHDGTCAGVAVFAEDMTDRRRAEERIRVMAEMLDTAPNAVTVHDDQGRFLYANRKSFMIHGWSEKEFVGMNIRELDLPESAALIEDRVRRIDEEGEMTFEVDHFRRDRSVVPLQIIAKRVEWLGQRALLSIGTDISERKKYEESLRQRDLELAAIHDHAPVMMCLLDEERRVLRANRALTEFVGRPISEIYLKRACGVLGCIYSHEHPEGCGFSSDCVKCSARSALADILTANRDHIGLEREFELMRPEGREKFVISINCSLLNLGDEKRILLYLQNVTEAKNVVNALKESSEQLRKLTAHIESVRESDRKWVAQEIHDELGQQLTALMMDITWAKKRVAKEPGTLYSKLIGMEALTDSAMKSVKKIAERLRPIPLEAMGLTGAIEWLVQEIAAHSGISKSLNIDLEDYIPSDEQSMALYRILQESLNNIVRHAEATQIQVDLHLSGEMIILLIEDNGKGIERANIDAHSSIGLMGMRERARFLGGDLSIERSSSGGTIVKAEIPIKKPDIYHD